MPNNQNKLAEGDLLKLKNLRDRTPEEWVERLNALPSLILPAAARLVWWDYFGLRTVGKRWPHLDSYIRFTTEEPPYGPLVEALIELGYPEPVARTRADNPRPN